MKNKTFVVCACALFVFSSASRGMVPESGESNLAPVTVAVLDAFLEENFEAPFVGGAPPGWTKSYVPDTEDIDWYRSEGDSRSTDAAFEGKYNAMLYYPSSVGEHKTWLIRQVAFQPGTTQATLEFAHKQVSWSGNKDTLEVYYKTSEQGDWQLLAGYTESVPDWVVRRIELPNLTNPYYIGFLGNARAGRGVCIDAVRITGVCRHPPSTPSLLSPENSATNQSLTPTLQASAFSDPDPGDSHANSQWQVDNNNDFSGPEWDSGASYPAGTQVTVPLGCLSSNTTYYWHVRYKDSTETWSQWSPTWSFKTQMLSTIYVDDDAPPGGDGSNWQRAFVNLQDALRVAAGSAGAVKEIRVGAGTYRPDRGANQKAGDRGATFQLMNGVAIRGGFAGFGEPDPDARDIDKY